MYEPPLRKVERDFWYKINSGIAEIGGLKENAVPISTVGYNSIQDYSKLSDNELRQRAASGDQKAIEEIDKRIEKEKLALESTPQHEPVETTTETPTETPVETPVETPGVEGQQEGEGIFDTTPTDEAQDKTLQAFFDYLDAAQKRVEEREDSSYQRAIADMRKAGINPNLLGSITPAESKGIYGQGITATGNLTATNMQDITKRIMQEIDNIFEAGENTKDRTKDYILGILNALAQFGGKTLSAFIGK